MQFAVPQFTDVEDKLIGPLTLKQFLVLLVAGGWCLLWWSLPLPKIISIAIDLPVALLGIALAFASYNGRPAMTYILPAISYFISPKFMIFSREATLATVVASTPVAKVEVAKEESIEPPDSRLKKLAYLLDQKKQEEQQLIEETGINPADPNRNIRVN